MDLSQVKAWRIPEGDVKSVSIGGVVVWRKVPYDAEVEYLEADGTQYIRTGLFTNYSTPLELETEVLWHNNTRAQVMGFNNRVYAGQTTSQKMQGASSVSLPSEVWHVQGAKWTPPATAGGAGTYEYYLGGSLVASGTYTTTASLECGVFVVIGTNGSPSNSYCKARIRRFKVLVDGVAARDFHPVRVGTTGYLFDRISGTLFGNAGTGTFGYGPDIN